MDDGWNTDPFKLTELDGKLFGRGSTDDKGPALSWLWVIEAHRELGIDLPVNIKLLYEGMEESGSEGMFELIVKMAKGPDGFLNDVDFFCISDNYWLVCLVDLMQIIQFFRYVLLNLTLFTNNIYHDIFCRYYVSR